MHPDPLLMNVHVADRQSRIRADIQAIRAQESRERPRRTGVIRRQLGQALIALGQHVGGATPATRQLPTQPVLSGAGQQ